MSQSKTLSQYLEQGVVFDPHEAVAIVQELIATGPSMDLVPPFGPITIDNVELATDGRVVCRHCGVTPAVSEVARLLESMLSRPAGVRVPGGLRYSIARALNEVDAAPFDSLAALSAALGRHERGDRNAVLRAIPARIVLERQSPEPQSPEAAPLPAAVNGRLTSSAPLAAIATRRRRAWLTAGAVAASISFSASYVLVLHSRIRRTDRTSQSPVASSIAATALPGSRGFDRPQLEAKALPRAGRHDAVEPAVPRTAGPMFSPSFASNGTALFFHTGRSADARSALAESPLGSDLEMMTILDDGARNYHVQPSPDGTRIAFDSDRAGERAVYVAGRDGSDVRRVSGSGYAAVPTWSPDGRQLAFVRAEPDRPRVWNLWLTTLATGEMSRLTGYRFGQTWGASWFPSGDAVAYTHENRLAILNLTDGTTRTFASPVPGRLVRTAAVSPNGRHIIFQVSRSGAWIVDLSDGSMRCVLTDPTAEEFAWAPDGRRVAFHSRRDGHWGIWLMAPES